MVEEVVLYWKHPRPGEYVSYKEITMLSIGWLAQYFVVRFSIGFSVGTVQLAQGYEKLSEILEGYDDAVNKVKAEKAESEEVARQLAEERKLDIERKKAQRRLKTRK